MFQILFNLAAELSDERISIIDNIRIVADDADGHELDWPEEIAPEIAEISPKDLWMESIPEKPEWAEYSAYYELPDGRDALLQWWVY